MSKRSRGPKSPAFLRPRPGGYPNSIRFYRLLRSLTLEQLAAKVGVSPQNLQRLEVEGGSLRTHRMLLLEDALECPLRELLAPVNSLSETSITS